MNFGIYPTLTKTYILERITQEDIMEKYLGIPVVFNTLVPAPPIIRIDNNPTCSFYYNSQGRLRFRDFSGAFWGDCFDVVAKTITVDSSDKRGFQMVLHTIAKDFKIHKYVNHKEVQNYNAIISNFYNKKKAKKKTIYKIKPRNYNYHDKAYWDSFNVSQTLLSIGKVYFAQEIYISNNGEDFSSIYRYTPKDPAYCYYGGKDINGIDEWKIYYPKRRRPEPRFHSNSSFLQGKHLITCDRVGIITKSFKDVLALRSFGLQAVAPSAESVLLTKSEYWFMRTKFDYLVSCMDYDRAGQRMAQMLRKQYRIQPFMFTNGRFNSYNFTVKDFAEYVNKYGVQDTQNLLINTFKPYQEDFRVLNQYYYESLKFIK